MVAGLEGSVSKQYRVYIAMETGCVNKHVCS